MRGGLFILTSEYPADPTAKDAARGAGPWRGTHSLEYHGVDSLDDGGFVIGPARVLLLDPDDEIAIQLTQSGQPWVVERARSLGEALELAAARSYHLAIIEMMLPDAAGTDAWTALSRRQPNLFGIMTTSSPSLHAYVNPMSGRILAYWLKPVKMEALRECVDAVVKSPRTNVATWDVPQRAVEQRAWISSLSPISVPDFELKRKISIAGTLASLAVALLLVLSGAGIAEAAQAALPGDALYSVKTSVEGIRLAVTPDGFDKGQLLLTLAENRVDEIQQLAAQGRYGEIPETVQTFEAEVESATATQNRMDKMNAASAQALAEKVKETLSHSTTVLEDVLQTVPAEARPAIAHALNVSEAGQSNAEQELSSPAATPTPGAEATALPGTTQDSSAQPVATPGPLNGVRPSKSPGPPNGVGPPKSPGPPNAPGPNNAPGQNKTRGPDKTPGAPHTPGPPKSPGRP